MMNCRLTSGNGELAADVGPLPGVAVPMQDGWHPHAAASLSAPPQLDPWPAVHP